MFDDVIKDKQNIKDLARIVNTKGVLIGKITHVRPNFEIRVLDLRSNENYVTNWLKPTLMILDRHQMIAIGLIVLYCYPLDDLNKGIYFDIVGLEF